MDKPYKGQIEIWQVIPSQSGNSKVVHGTDQKSGNYIRTSSIVSINGNLVETRNSYYTLGKALI